MTTTDNCPQCCQPAVPATRTHHCQHQIVTGHICPRCGHTWITQRLKDAYREAA